MKNLLFLIIAISSLNLNAEILSCVGEAHAGIKGTSWVVDAGIDTDELKIKFDLSVPALIYYNQPIPPAKLDKVNENNNIFIDNKNYVYYFSTRRDFVVMTRVIDRRYGAHISSTIYECYLSFR